MVVPPDRVLPGLAATGGYEEILTEQAEEWLAQAAANVPDGIEATTHVSSTTSRLPKAHRQRAAPGSRGDRGRSNRRWLIGRHSIGSVTGELLYSAPVPLALALRGTRHSKVDRSAR